MAVQEQRQCDLCRSPIPGKCYVAMTLEDMRLGEGPEITDLCLVCYDKIRSFIRNGLKTRQEAVKGVLNA